MHRCYQAALGLLVDAYEAPSTIKGAGLGLFLGEEHLKKGDIIALYSGKWIARQADQHHRYTGKNPNVMLLDDWIICPQAGADGLARFINENPVDVPATAAFIRWHRVGDILPRYQWPTDIKAAHGMDAVGVHAAADIGPHQEICAHAMTTRLMRARLCSPACAHPLVRLAVAHYGKAYDERRTWDAGAPAPLHKKHIDFHQRPGRVAEASHILVPGSAFRFRL